ncbi:hypothetical protein CEXT_387191 [Caerostris extrusa]|uniref:Uncharacterized protein n=1 Tax=Caerostris extrusa TaxID=172846 RepID=A0AAV4P5N1_CAEEX|nr:hypothetical protein CEXT_387191 [Caerostris extrusa]
MGHVYFTHRHLQGEPEDVYSLIAAQNGPKGLRRLLLDHGSHGRHVERVGSPAVHCGGGVCVGGALQLRRICRRLPPPPRQGRVPLLLRGAGRRC